MLVPREHGAWGELLFPLAAALLIGPRPLAAVPWVVAAVMGFLLHEGLVVLLGLRGPRARRQHRADAIRSVAIFGIAGAASAGYAIWRLREDEWSAVAFAALWSALALLLTWRGRERSLGGELIVAAALAALSVPVMIAAAQPMRNAIAIWGVWTTSFAVVTPVVHVIVGRTTRRPIRAALVTALTLAIVPLAAAIVTWRRQAVSVYVPVAIAPSAVCAAVLLAAPVTARALRRIGWTFVIVHAVTCAILVYAFR